MTIRVAARRLAVPASSLPRTPTVLSKYLGPTVQYRSKWIDTLSGAFKSLRVGSAARKASASDAGGAALEDPKKRQEQLARTLQTSNTEGSIFQDEIETPKSKENAASPIGELTRETEKTRANTAMVTDPDPRARVRWQRKKVIQMVKRNGQLTKEERLKMTERELLHKSAFLPTSVKKLVMLSRQISGKTVDEAISQMQWSKKKMGAEIKYYLEEARDLAIAERGMGLGRVNGELFDTPRKIQTKEGKWIEVTDPSRLYIAQSWVGRGEWRGKEIDYKGRGRMGVIQHPATSITVVLKEEKTRIREYEERQAKKQAKGPWVHLPNRKIHGQRPYYSW
ncbi:unnamed protein product [Clonostachys rosea]|uniref:Mitochondrial large ribosomal subunit n=1 Tax=Bionectria ochroleuca TaxID=29856 RepID=A0ABY6TTG9_BIOOC|nr:unnamed protein product [Clonostachys rosea]